MKNEENRKNHRVIGIDITTGQVLHWDSLSEASKEVGISAITISRAAKMVKPSGGYVWCNPGDEQRAAELAAYMRKSGLESRQRGRPRKKTSLVWIQIDSHTRILVKPEEATPEFAIKYLKKLKKQ